MAMYVTFPVVLFYYFNQPAYFEEWVTKTKREIYPPDSKSADLRAALKDLQEKQELKRLKELEKTV